MDVSINSPIDKTAAISRHVKYTSNAALKKGQAVCYNLGYGTTTVREPRRLNEVVTPTTLNAQHFAGVAARAYSAKEYGQFIEIYVPGSVCDILCGKDTNTEVGVGILTFDVTSDFEGFFRYAGLEGEGSAQPLQETTGDASDPGLCLAKLQVGPPSGGVEVVPLVAGPGALCTPMVGGSTLITGGAIASGHNTLAVLDGTINGLRKKFGIITAELTAYNVVVNPATGSFIDAADTTLGTVTFTNTGTCADKSVVLEWGGSWTVIGITRDEPKLA